MIGKEERVREESSIRIKKYPLSVAFIESLGTVTKSSQNPFRTSRNYCNAHEISASVGRKERTAGSLN